jgi:hypothetical protein
MFWPLIQISPIWPSGSSVAVSLSTMTAHSATPILPADACATAFSESGGTSTNRWLFSSLRSTVMIFGDSLTGVVETNSVASASP